MVSKYALLAAFSTAFVVNAQSAPAADPLAGLPLSSACKTGFQALGTSKIASCLNINGFLAIAGTSPTASLVQPIDSWISGMCGSGECTAADIISAFDGLQSACSTDFTMLGLGPDTITMVKAAISTYFPTVRKVVCLKDGGSFCITSALKALEKQIGKPLSITALTTDVATLSSTSYSKDVTCTQCTKAAYAVLKQDFPALTAGYDPALSQQCGADFLSSAATGISSPSGTGTAAAAGSSKGASTSSAAAFLLSTPALLSSLVATVFGGIALV